MSSKSDDAFLFNAQYRGLSDFGMRHDPTPRISEDDIHRIADAVADRLKPSILSVTDADVQRYCPGLKEKRR